MASVMYSSTPDCTSCGGCEVSVHLQLRAEVKACAGISVGTEVKKGAPEPIATVPLHMAGHVEGLCPSFLHDAPMAGQVQRESRST